jgi:hypothetical protein
MSVSKCLNDWNATVEALGQGKQTILIRKNITNAKEFLLYPTISYANNDDYLNSFKSSMLDFVKENTLPDVDGKKYKVKYFAKIEEIFKTPVSRIAKFKNYHIWTNRHVSGYLNTQTANIWLLRVYELDEPQFLKRSKAMVFVKVDKEVDVSNVTPVIDDEKFAKLKDAILSK